MAAVASTAVTSSFVQNKYPKKPSPITGGWLPEDPNSRIDFLRKFFHDIEKEKKKRGGVLVEKFDPTIQALADLIDDSAQLSMFFVSMFEEIPFSHRNDPLGNTYTITNYTELLEKFQYILNRAPPFNENMMIALPFTVLLEWPMATRGGLAAFLDKNVNEKMGAILSRWGDFLKTEQSKIYLTNDPNDPLYPESWLSPASRAIMQERDPHHLTFEQEYKCNPNDKYLGYKSWDAFFTREFNDGVRPVKDTSDNTITSGCESAPYAIKQQVSLKEQFWIKGQPYSLKHMLDSTEDAQRYAKGTVYQAFLSPLTYHRWHSPINGKINKLRIVEGSYFSISPINAFPDPETFANTQSQPYLSAVATRALIFIENSTVGEMVMIPIGMVEVSTCVFSQSILDKMEPVQGQHKTWVPKAGTQVDVKKGDELGMFHFGGSTHCLVFGPQVTLKFHQTVIPLDTEANYFVPLNAVVADVQKRDPSKNIWDV